MELEFTPNIILSESKKLETKPFTDDEDEEKNLGNSCYSTASHEYVNTGVSKPTHLEILVINKCKARSLELDEALGFFNSLISMRPFPSIVSFNHLLGAVSKMKHYALVASMCKQMIGCSEFQPDVVAMTIWLRCLCNLKKVKLGFSVFAMIIKLGFQPDPYTMNALLLGLIDEGKIVEAMELFWKLLKNGYPCNQTMIRMYCALGEMNKAKEVFDSMETEGFAPDLMACKMLINGYAKSKRKDETVKLAEEMLQKGLTLDVETHSMLRGLTRQ
ncbi:hypothetical protein V6N13_080407 [Hibiscus sabdariffa]